LDADEDTKPQPNSFKKVYKEHASSMTVYVKEVPCRVSNSERVKGMGPLGWVTFRVFIQRLAPNHHPLASPVTKTATTSRGGE